MFNCLFVTIKGQKAFGCLVLDSAVNTFLSLTEMGIISSKIIACYNINRVRVPGINKVLRIIRVFIPAEKVYAIGCIRRSSQRNLSSNLIVYRVN